MLTARDIQRRLLHDNHRRSFVLPNYTPKNWFECDVFEVTGAGFFREYEIKLTAQDFKADRKKAVEKLELVKTALAREWSRVKGPTKHEQLRAGAVVGPRQFFFVMPRKLANRVAVPDWAGIIAADEWAGHKPPFNVNFEKIKNAPKLHSVKADPIIVGHARGVTYYRFLNAFCYSKFANQDEP